MATSDMQLLQVLHSAWTHDGARNILGAMSSADMTALGQHLNDGTLMPALKSFDDEADPQAALKVMPADIGNAFGKLSDSDLDAFVTQLRQLQVDKHGVRICQCKTAPGGDL